MKKYLMGRERTGEKKEKKEWGEDRRTWICLILLVMRNFGVTSAASQHVQNREGRMEGVQWKNEMAREKT